MAIAEQDRAALNDPALEAPSSRLAYKSRSEAKPGFYGGEAWAKKHGFDFAAANADDAK
jgi:hypothetical protein